MGKNHASQYANFGSLRIKILYFRILYLIRYKIVRYKLYNMFIDKFSVTYKVTELKCHDIQRFIYLCSFLSIF